MVKELSYYLHSYDFEFPSPIISGIKDYVSKDFEDKNNILHPDSRINDFICKKFSKILNKNYIIGDLVGNTFQYPTFSKINNKKDSWVNNMDVVMVVCMAILNKSKNASIDFKYFPHESMTITPQLNKLYVFPAYVAYRPTPLIDNNSYISLTWGYNTNTRLINKFIGKRW